MSNRMTTAWWLSSLYGAFGEGVNADRGSGFLARVESIRGVAALMVALMHGFLVLNGQWEIWLAGFPPVNSIQAFTTKSVLTLCNGQAAVTMFFVISGFVLGRSLDRGKSGFLQNATRFVVRRAFRIYPAHLVILICTVEYLAVHHVVSQRDASGYFNYIYQQPITLYTIGANIFLLTNTINPPTWTLTVEMVAALLLPVLHVLDRTVTPVQRLGVLAVLMMVCYEFHDVIALMWLFAFYLGLMLSSWGSFIASRMSQGLLWTRAAFALAFCTFMLVRPALHGHGTDTPPFVQYVEAIAAAVVLALIVYGRELHCYRLLDHPLIRFYGRISYSLYLCHYLVMYIFATMLFTYAPDGSLMRYPVVYSAMIAAVTVLGATILAVLSYVWVEKPGIEIGREFAGRVWRKKLIAAT